MDAPSNDSRSDARLAWAAGGALLAFGASALLGPVFAAHPAPQEDTPQFTRSISTVGSSGMASDSNNRMIAVTGVDITGQSVLYLVDTIDKQLAVYQASGGAPGTQSIRLVGARRIDLDLQLEGLNDKTTVDGRPLKYSDLERAFVREVDGGK